MASLKLIFKLIGLSSMPQTELAAPHDRRIALADGEVETFSSSGTRPLRAPTKFKPSDGPAWPPPDGVYWGM